MVKKVLVTVLGIFLLGLPVTVFGSYPLFQYPNLPAFNEKNSSGAFHVYVQKDGIWEQAGQLSFDRYFRQRTLDLTRYAGDNQKITVKLTKQGGGNAHIDSVLLNAKPPLKVSNTEADIKKFARDDFDVVDATDKVMEFEFVAEKGRAVLSLTARIEEEVISKTPFQYPTANLYKEVGHNSKFYTYKIEKDGKGVEREIFKEYSLSGSGHPSGYTYGWVGNDRENLYVTIDFTPDNTMDGDKDYAKVYVKTGDFLREFKVTATDEKWGKALFTYTDKVSYEHKLYRFQIPLKEIGDAKEIEMAFSAYGTAAPAGGDFGRTTRQYLVAYESGGDIYGQLVGENGVAVGSAFVISNATGGQYWPSVAYNSSTNQFLVVWGDTRSGTNSDIYGQLVNANGSLNGANFVISNATGYQYSPSVAYNSSTNQFLVVWGDYRSGTNSDIYGQLVNANGSLNGANFVISNATGYQYWPSVAYNSSTNQFLVAWEDSRSGNSDIYGQLVNANGSLNGANFVISNATGDQYLPSVAYNSSTNQFLVAWEDSRSGNSDIYGQLVNANGSLNGANFVISNATGDQYWPSVAYNSSTNQFLVAWGDYRSGTNWDIYGQLVNANGSLNGANFVIQNVAYSPHTIANAFCPNYLVTFWDGNLDRYSWTLYGGQCQQGAVSVPTMTEWGMIIFMVLAGAGTVYYLSRRPQGY